MRDPEHGEYYKHPLYNRRLNHFGTQRAADCCRTREMFDAKINNYPLLEIHGSKLAGVHGP